MYLQKIVNEVFAISTFFNIIAFPESILKIFRVCPILMTYELQCGGHGFIFNKNRTGAVALLIQKKTVVALQN